jgi:hypothetical protein
MKERDCALQCHDKRTVEWVNARLAIKKRRADLLGLDAPKRTEVSGADGGPIQTDWRTIETVVLEALWPYPEARVALAEAVEQWEGNGHDG